MLRNVGVSEKGCLTKMHKEKTAHCNYLLPYPWPKKIMLDIQDQTMNPRLKEAMKTLYLIIKTLVINIIKKPFCSKKA